MASRSTSSSRLEISPSNPIRNRRSSSSVKLRISNVCARCKRLKILCSTNAGMDSCKRCIQSGEEENCFFPGRKTRSPSRISSHRSRSRSPRSASSREGAGFKLSALNESEEDEAIAAQKQDELANVPAPEQLDVHLCIACEACEMVDDGWVIPQHFGVKTYVPIALSPLCPVCNSNTHEFRGRVPKPASPRTGYHWSGASTGDPRFNVRAQRASKPSSPTYSNAPPYEERLPVLASASGSLGEVVHSAASPRIDGLDHPTKVAGPSSQPALLSLAALLLWSSQNLHLLTMLWIPRFYENQIRLGALRYEVVTQLDSDKGCSVDAYETALERTEAGIDGRDNDEEAVAKMRLVWTEFVESRVFEWNILISIALVLIAASPTVFQIPSANDDRLIRTLTFLSISRAVAGLVFGIILSLHFRSPLTRSAAYIRSWLRVSSSSRPLQSIHNIRLLTRFAGTGVADNKCQSPELLDYRFSTRILDRVVTDTLRIGHIRASLEDRRTAQ